MPLASVGMGPCEAISVSGEACFSLMGVGYGLWGYPIDSRAWEMGKSDVETHRRTGSKGGKRG